MKAILFVLLGIALAIGAIASANTIRHAIGGAQRAAGEVTALRAGGSHPTITFTTATGERINFPQNGWIAGYAIGDRVTVLYHAEDPQGTASIDAVGALWAWPIMLSVMGAVFLLAGATMLVAARRS